MNTLSNLVASYLSKFGYNNLEIYQKILRETCEVHPQPYSQSWYGKQYRELAIKPNWFAKSLIINANMEGYGATQIWAFSQIAGNEIYAEHIRSHSIDESRHSKMFVMMLEMMFPDVAKEIGMENLLSLSPGYTKSNHPSKKAPKDGNILSEANTVEELIHINLIEVRAFILQMLLRPVLLAYSAKENRKKLSAMSNRLIQDEIKHIAYSASCIEDFARNGNQDFVRASMINRQAQVNDETLEELELEGIAVQSELL